MTGRKVGSYAKDNCPRCGAPKSAQRFPYRKLIDISELDAINDMHPEDAAYCKHCGTAFRVAHLEYEDGFIVNWQDEGCLWPNFCPVCGKKLELD